MKRKRFTEEQIVGILREHEAGVPVTELCRKHGVSDASIYKWKATRQAVVGNCGQAFPAKVIHHAEDAEAPATAQGIRDKVYAPALVGLLCTTTGATIARLTLS